MPVASQEIFVRKPRHHTDELNSPFDSEAPPAVEGLSGVKLSRRDCLMLAAAGVATIAARPLVNLVDSWPTQDKKIPEFTTVLDALDFLKGKSGARRFYGDAVKEAQFVPWENTIAWSELAKLKTGTTNGVTLAYLLPLGNVEYGVVGVERFLDKTLLDFINTYGAPSTIIVEGGKFDFHDFLGVQYDALLNTPVLLWPTINYPNANSAGQSCTTQLRNPSPGVIGGFVCSSDGSTGRYFQGNGKYSQK